MRTQDDEMMAAVADLTGAHFAVRAVAADVGSTMLIRFSATGQEEALAVRVPMPSSARMTSRSPAGSFDAAAAAARLGAVLDGQVATGSARGAATTRRGDDRLVELAPYGFRRADTARHRRLLTRVGAVDRWRGIYDPGGPAETPAARELARLATLPFSYPDPGVTRGDVPKKYRTVHRYQRLGSGRAWFQTAAERLMTWDMHRRAGLLVHGDPGVALGGVALLDVHIGSLWLSAPVRVVEMVDERTVIGFAYGTLPGHPESGEERFLVRLHADGTVVGEIRACSRPGQLLTRLGGPVARRLQDSATQRYLDALTEGDELGGRLPAPPPHHPG